MILRRACAAIALLVSTGCRTIVWYGHSPGRTHHVEVVERSGCQHVAVDGEAGPSFEAVGIPGLTVLDHGMIVYAARRSDGWRVVIDGREGEPWEGIGEIAVSSDGRHVAYVALRDGAWRVVVDGRTGPPLDAVFAGTLRVSSTGVVAYVAERAGRAHAVVGERLGRAFDGISSLAISADGAHVGWLAREGAGQRAVVDGVDGATWLEASDLVLLHDGRAAHAGRDREGWWVEGPSARYGPYDAVTSLRPSPLAGLVFVARRDRREFVVEGGAEGPRYDQVRELVVGDEGRIGYLARRAGRDVAVVEGRARAAWPRAAGLLLGPGQRWATVAHDGETARVVHDAGEVEVPAAMPDTLVFGAAGRWAVMGADERGFFIAVEGGTRCRIDAEEIAAEAMRAGRDLQGFSARLRRWAAVEADRRCVSPRVDDP